MWKAIVAAIALTIAGSTLIYAQQPPRPELGPDRHESSPEDRAAFLNARIAALKAGLGLSAAQEKNWSAFEQAIRDFAKLRADRREGRRDSTPPSDPIERLRQRADAMTQGGAALKQLVDATQPLYQSLDDAQKRRFMILAGSLWPGMRHHHRAGPEDRRERSDQEPGR